MKKHTTPELVALRPLGTAQYATSAPRLARAAADTTAPSGARRGGFGRGFFGRGQMAPPGPPAPVPPEVAIPRPTLAEVNRMNADLKQFIATSPDKVFADEV